MHAQGPARREKSAVTESVVIIVQELCESRGGRPGLSVLTEPYGFLGRKAILNHASALVSLSLICQPTSEDIKQHYLPTACTRLIGSGVPRMQKLCSISLSL